jgi:hypothetical protein
MQYTVSATEAYQSIREQSLPTESAAIRLAKQWGTEYAGTNIQVLIHWFRPSDGQHGYLNPNGADFTGQSWTKNVQA